MPLTVLQVLPALEAGGVERGTVETATGLVRRGRRALVVSAGGSLAAALTAAGARRYDWPIGRKSPLTLLLVRRLRRLAAPAQPLDEAERCSRLLLVRGLVGRLATPVSGAQRRGSAQPCR